MARNSTLFVRAVWVWLAYVLIHFPYASDLIIIKKDNFPGNVFRSSKDPCLYTFKNKGSLFASICSFTNAYYNVII